MRPIALSLTAFQGYADTVEVEFTHLEKAGVYVITGETGSGKTTLLDAMCWALYGELPGARKSTKGSGLRNLAAPTSRETRVVFVFDVKDGRRFRVTRAPAQEGAKKRGAGTTTRPAAASVDQWEGGGWVPVKTSTKEVNNFIRDLLGLTDEEFSTVLLLAQGEVTKALAASPSEREELFRKLFKTQQYKAITERLSSKAKALNEAVQSRQALVDAATRNAVDAAAATLARSEVDAFVDPPEVATLDDAQIALETAKKAVDSLHASAVDVVSRARDLVSQQQEADRLWEVSVSLKAEQDFVSAKKAEVEIFRDRVSRLDKAQSLKPQIDSLDGAVSKSTTAEHAVVDAQSRVADALTAVCDSGAPVVASISAASNVDLIREVKDKLSALTTDAARIDSLVGMRSAEESRRAASETKLSDLKAENERLVSELNVLDARMLEVDELICQAEARLIGFDDLKSQLTKVMTAVEVDQKVADLTERRLEVAAAEEAAHSAFEAGRRRWLEDTSAQLALDLVHGEPCSVCGSTEHPKPATITDSGADAGDLTKLEEAYRDAFGALQTVDAEILAMKATRPDTADLATLAILQAAVDDIQTQADNIPGWRDERSVILGQQSDIAIRRAAIVVELGHHADAQSAAVNAIAGLGDEIAHLQASLARELGDADLAGLAGAVDAALAVFAELERVRGEASSAVRLVEELQSALRASLAVAGFGTAEEATHVLADAPGIELLRNQVREFDAVVARVKVLEGDLRGKSVPIAKPDLTEAQTTLDAADAQERAVGTAVNFLQAGIDGLNRERDDINARVIEIDNLQAGGKALLRVAGAVKGTTGSESAPGLEAWVLQATLEDVAAASNTWLKNLSDHRYEMVANENSGAERGKTSLAISIRDGDSGDLREVNTLSGGEKFQAALAFALGLGAVVTEASAATHLGCLFIDEGFGTLDDNSRAAAVEQLQKLRQGGRRTVGVITHIKEIKDILEIGIEIKTEGRGRRRGVSVNQPAIRHYTPEPNWKTLLKVGESE